MPCPQTSSLETEEDIFEYGGKMVLLSMIVASEQDPGLLVVFFVVCLLYFVGWGRALLPLTSLT